MKVTLADDSNLAERAAAAGFAAVDDYVQHLVNAERAAIRIGIDAMEAGDGRSFVEFDAEFRRERGLPPCR